MMSSWTLQEEADLVFGVSVLFLTFEEVSACMLYPYARTPLECYRKFQELL